MIIGSHVSFESKNQLVGSVNEALKYNANTFMFYTGAPQNTNRCEINVEKTNEAKKIMEENNIDINNVIVHAPYIINLANSDPEKHQFAINFLFQELDRVEKLGCHLLVLHPGSHVGGGIETGIENIIDGLNKCMHNNVTILLETMAGKGTEVGSTFEEIKEIIDKVNDKEHIGVCLDTCHINDSGYDLNNFDKVLEEFDNIIGIKYLKCIHVNDSKNIMGSHKDRHENIGYGEIGFEKLIKVLYNSKLDNIPKILETPYIGEYAPYKDEIEMIRNKKFNDFKNNVCKLK